MLANGTDEKGEYIIYSYDYYNKKNGKKYVYKKKYYKKYGNKGRPKGVAELTYIKNEIRRMIPKVLENASEEKLGEIKLFLNKYIIKEL